MLNKKSTLSKLYAKEAFENLMNTKMFKELVNTTRVEKLIQTGIPIGNPVNSVVPGDTVMNQPNAQVIGNQNVPMIYANGTIVPSGYASPGNDIKILEIFEGLLLVLVPVGSGPEGDGQWCIGYMETDVLGDTVEVNYNTITWNDSSNKTVVDSNGDVIYSLPATQTIQFLYETPNKNYMCILFNGSNGQLLTGYVAKSLGKFLRWPNLRTGSLQAPGIANNNSSLPTGINMNLQTGLSTLDGNISVIYSFNDINSGDKVPTYFELSNGLGCTVLTANGDLKSGTNLNTLKKIIDNSGAANLCLGYYHHLYDTYNYPDAISCRGQGITFGNALMSNHIPSTNYVLGLRVDEISFNNVTSINLPEIELRVNEFMEGLESVMTGNYTVMIYTSLNMINNVSTPPMYKSSSLTDALLWMDSYIPGLTDSTYEPTNTQIVNAFYEMNSIQWGGQTGWSIWGYENSNNITSCIVNLDAIYVPNMYYNPVRSSSNSGLTGSNGTSQPTNNLQQGDTVQIKQSAQYFAIGALIGSLNNNAFKITELININNGASDQSGYVIKDSSDGQEYNIYSNQVAKDTSQMIEVGWKEIDNSWYYFNKSGIKVTGWQEINNLWYYFNTSGVMQIGWQKLNQWFYLTSQGIMLTGWAQVGNSIYYFNNSGYMIEGQVINGVKLSANGSVSNFNFGISIDTSNYTWSSVNGEEIVKDNGVPITGWFIHDGQNYYSNSKGVIQTGWVKIDNLWYYFNKSGAKQTGWLQLDNDWYYLLPNGIMVSSGAQIINNKLYFFNTTGAMLSNTKIDGYIISSSGAAN